jgi:hypothetical protein
VLPGVRDSLKQKLSPDSFNRTRYWWWYGKFYLPRRAASTFHRRTPSVYGKPSELLESLRGVNVFAPTPMCRVMTKYGSDKGNSWHNYTAVYSHLFGKLRNREMRIFELGLCRNEPQSESGAKVEGHPGASLRGWRELFPRAMVFGADIERDVLFTEDRIDTFYCDQLDSDAIRDMWAQPALHRGIDIIIEDGLHTFPASVSFLAGSLEHVRVGGFYVVEDINRKDFQMWQEQLPTYAKQFSNFDFVLAELPNALNNYDNNLLVIQRRS